MATAFEDVSEGRRQREAVQRTWTGVHAPARHVDPLLALTAVALSLLGLVFIYSATSPVLESGGLDPLLFVNRQLIALGVGLAAMAVAMSVDYRVLQVWAPVLYGVAIVMLIVLAIVGEAVSGSARWLVIGGLQFQPSELAKPALIVVLAALFHERRESALGLRALVEALALAAVPMVLVILQPDLGTAMVFVAITFAVLLLARVRVRYMAALAVIGVVSILGALQLDLIQEYQLERLTSFLNPEAADVQDDLYNLNQAQIAIGSGQLAGQGLFEGTQTQLSYVPENHTDFIFTVPAEELGFLGSSLVLGLFGMLLYRGLRIAALSRDTFGTLIAGGVVAVIAFQAFINIGMSLGLMPITGLPLPFLSYGGTSLISTFILIGILQNVHMRRFS